MSDPIISVKNLTKHFSVIKALTDVSFNIFPGEVHAICGENGAGKSTMMNLLAGVLTPTSGEILVDGTQVRLTSPSQAQSLGIVLVHQEISLCPDATIAENIFMSTTAQRKNPFMNFKKLQEDAQRVMNRLSPIDVSKNVSSLSISSQQLVEIAKALTLDCRVLILDEPTAALTETEARKLFEIIKDLKARGVAIVYISHRMAEVFSLCDRVTVLRDGRYVCTEKIGNTSPDDLVKRMVGRDVGQLYPEKTGSRDDNVTPILTVSSLDDGVRVHGVDFDLMPGEILGIGGLIGSGRTEIAETICGLRPCNSGAITLNGKRVTIKSYRDSVAQGIVYLSEDRKGSGVFLDMSIAENISVLDLKPITNAFGFIKGKTEKSIAQSLAEKLSVRMANVDVLVRTLSGGNQQKVAIAKQLAVEPKVIIMDEPTRGIDVGAKVEIHRLLRELAQSGIGIIVISSEMPELLGLSDRILVVRDGKIEGTLDAETMSEEAIIRLASGLGNEGENRNVA